MLYITKKQNIKGYLLTKNIIYGINKALNEYVFNKRRQ